MNIQADDNLQRMFYNLPLMLDRLPHFDGNKYLRHYVLPLIFRQMMLLHIFLLMEYGSKSVTGDMRI